MNILSNKEIALYQLLRDNKNRGIIRYEKYSASTFFKKHGFTLNILRSLERSEMVNVATITADVWRNSRNVWSSGTFIEISFE